MINVIAESLFTVPNILTPQECAEFIERGEGIGFESATVSTTENQCSVSKRQQELVLARDGRRVVSPDAGSGSV